MKIIENELVHDIITDLIPKEILDKKPVIAGGFMVMLYEYIVRNKNDLTNKITFSKSIASRSVASDTSWGYTLLSKVAPDIKSKYDDIDFWFLSNNEIWNSEDPCSYLVSNVSPKDGEKGRANGMFRSIYTSVQQIFAKNINQTTLKSTLSYTNSSVWANSFNYCTPSANFKYQFIKKKYENIESLFANFDIYNCCIAYHDGKVYIHDNAEKGFNESLLLPNLSIHNESYVKRLFLSSRAFKYSDRYAWELSEDMMSIIFDIYQDTITVSQSLKNNSNSVSFDVGELDAIKDPYGRNGSIPLNKLHFMMAQLYEKFGYFSKLRHYKEVWTMYMINCEDHNVKSEVASIIEKSSAEYRNKNMLLNNSLKITEINKPEATEKQQTTAKQKLSQGFDNAFVDMLNHTL